MNRRDFLKFGAKIAGAITALTALPAIAAIKGNFFGVSGVTTLDVNGLGAKIILRNDGSAPIKAGDLMLGQNVAVSYNPEDGTWRHLNGGPSHENM